MNDGCPDPDCPDCGGTGKVYAPGTRWFRPGPEFRGRVLGRWPSGSTFGVWTEDAWNNCLVRRAIKAPVGIWPEIGCDVARYGVNWTAIHVKWNCTSLMHERHNGWDIPLTSGRLIELVREYAEYAARETGFPCPLSAIQVKVDDDGVGGGVSDTVRLHNSWSAEKDQYTVIPVSGSGRANEPELYTNRRSEGWFMTAARAANGLLDFSRLPPDILDLLRVQFMVPIWRLQGGRRVVEPKEETEKRTKRPSPDDADAVNLAYLVSHTIPPIPEGTRVVRESRS
jgi:hypothetical protein